MAGIGLRGQLTAKRQ